MSTLHSFALLTAITAPGLSRKRIPDHRSVGGALVVQVQVGGSSSSAASDERFRRQTFGPPSSATSRCLHSSFADRKAGCPRRAQSIWTSSSATAGDITKKGESCALPRKTAH